MWEARRATGYPDQSELNRLMNLEYRRADLLDRADHVSEHIQVDPTSLKLRNCDYDACTQATTSRCAI